MNNYVQVSNDLFEVFEKAANTKTDCEITYKDKKAQVTVNSKILEIRNVNNSEFMEVDNGAVIRLDKIVEFNGELTSKLNHY